MRAATVAWNVTQFVYTHTSRFVFTLHTRHKAQNYVLRSVRLLNNSKMICRIFKQYMTACSMHKITSLCKHGSSNVCFSNYSPFKERDAVRVQGPFPRYEVRPTAPSPPMLEHHSITDCQKYASVAAEESYDAQHQLTKTRWISLFFFLT